jgi:hypothetical protein
MSGTARNLIRLHPDPLVRTAVEALEKIADADFRGNRPGEQVEAQRALDKLDTIVHDAIVAGEERPQREKAKPDYSQAWVRGFEHVTQEGTELRKLREGYGLTRADVDLMAPDGILPIPQQELLEEYPGLLDLDELYQYAVIFSSVPYAGEWVATKRKPEPPESWSIGGLLNYLLERTGEPMIEEDREAEEAGRAAAAKLYRAIHVGGGKPANARLTEQEQRDARRYIDEHRLRHPSDYAYTLDSRPVPDYWRDDGIDHAARTASFVGWRD